MRAQNSTWVLIPEVGWFVLSLVIKKIQKIKKLYFVCTNGIFSPFIFEHLHKLSHVFIQKLAKHLGYVRGDCQVHGSPSPPIWYTRLLTITPMPKEKPYY